jgi:hypothetical protein
MLTTSELLQKLIEIQRLSRAPKQTVSSPIDKSSTSHLFTTAYSSSTAGSDAEHKKIAAMEKRAREREAQQAKLPAMVTALKAELPPNSAEYVDALLTVIQTDNTNDHLLPNELARMDPPVSNLGFSLQVYQAILPYAQLAYSIEKNGSPELHAYKLAIMFGDPQAAIEYILDYSKEDKNDTQPFHNACLFQLPSVDAQNWNVDTWRRLAKNRQKPMLDAKFRKCLTRANEIEKILGDKFKNATIIDIKKTYNTLFYKGVTEETLHIAEVFNTYGASQADFDKYVQEVLPIARQKNMTVNNTMIPDIVFNGAEVGFPGYTIEKLHHLDPMCAMLGDKTGCCQSIGGQGESCAIHGITNEHSGFYVLRKGKEIKAQSWAWRGTNGALVLDSIEAQQNVLDGKIGQKNGHDLICAMYQGFAKKLITEKGIDEVRVGTSGQTPDEVGETNTPWCNNSYPQDYKGYRDSREQRLILSKDSLWLEYFDPEEKDNKKLFEYLNTLLANHPNTDIVKIPAMRNFILLCVWDDYDTTLEAFISQTEFSTERKQQIESFFRKYKLISDCTWDELPAHIESPDTPIEVLQMPFDSKTLYHIAVLEKKMTLMKALIKKRLDPNTINRQGQSPLILAITKGNAEIAKELIEMQGIDLNLPDNEGNTPLIVAIKYGLDKIALMLIEKEGVDVNADNFESLTALELAIKKGAMDIIVALTQRLDLQPPNADVFLNALGNFIIKDHPKETIKATISTLTPLFFSIVKDPTKFILWLHPYKSNKAAEKIILGLGTALDPLIQTPSDYIFVLNCLKRKNINNIDFLNNKIGDHFKTSHELIQWLHSLSDRSRAVIAMIKPLKKLNYPQNADEYNEILKLAGKDASCQFILNFGPVNHLIHKFDELEMIVENISYDSMLPFMQQLGDKLYDIIVSREQYDKFNQLIRMSATEPKHFDRLLDKIPDFENLNDSDVLYFFRIFDDDQREKLLTAFGPKIYKHLTYNVFFHILGYLPIDSRASYIAGIDNNVFAKYFDEGMSRAAVLQRLPDNAQGMFFEKLGEHIKKMDTMDLFDMLSYTTVESSALMFKNLGDEALPAMITMIQSMQLKPSIFQDKLFANKVPAELLEAINTNMACSATPSTRPTIK